MGANTVTPISQEEDRYLREKEVASLTGLSVAWLRRDRWKKEQGSLPYVKLTGAVLYRKSSVLAWLQAREVK